MKKLILLFIGSMAFFTAFSQKNYFIYLQSEAEQPFFVKMNERIYSSTASGYLILSKLYDSTYNFSIGFPQNKPPEQKFSVAVNKKDHGFLIKNFNEKGWGLFDLQTLEIQLSLAGGPSMEDKNRPENKDVSAFTDILSKAADDPTLKERPVVAVIEEKKPAPAVQQPEKKEETKTAIKEPVENTGQPTVKKTEPKTAKKAETEEKPVVNADPVLVPGTEIKEKAIVKPVENAGQPLVINKEPATNAKDEKDIKTAASTDQAVVNPKPEPKEESGSRPIENSGQPIIQKQELKTDIKDGGAVRPMVNTDQPAVTKPAPKTEIKEETGAKTVDVIEQPVLKKEEVKTEPAVLIPEAESTTDYKRSQVIKKSESSTTDGFGLTFIDQYENGIKDTIRLLIPNPKPALSPSVNDQPKEEKKFLDMNTDTGKNIKPAVSGVAKGSCADIAGESDFFKLRKKMAAQQNDEDMIAEAKKYFKVKCFLTAQIKNIGTLFLTDNGRYKFFDAAYIYAADPENFISLQSEMKEEYYINRFKAMLRN